MDEYFLLFIQRIFFVDLYSHFLSKDFFLLVLLELFTKSLSLAPFVTVLKNIKGLRIYIHYFPRGSAFKLSASAKVSFSPPFKSS